MKTFLTDKKTLKKCHIYRMLARASREKHLSFHTPGHKIAKWDLTELSFSDNLSNPKGCIARAQTDIAQILGAKASYILTDGSTCGIFCMLYALKELGVTSVAIPFSSHKSVYNACSVFGIYPVTFQMEKDEYGIEKFPSLSVIESALESAQALIVVSPNYYGQVADLSALRELCLKAGKPLLVDGAHGGHLHYDKNLYAGEYADLWVDGVHKSLPALTQGAVVSAKTEKYAKLLREAVDIFRTTSPSYPIMASVEYAVKFPKNQRLEKAVREFAGEYSERARLGADYTKLCLYFGKSAFLAEKYFEKKGVYAEFCDGNIIEFYLSPATSVSQFKALRKLLVKAFALFPVEPIELVPAPDLSTLLLDREETESISLDESVGRLCACTCGLFPPCTPLIFKGERVTEEKIRLLKNADNTFGLQGNKISVFKE